MTPPNALNMTVREIFALGGGITYPDGSGQQPCQLCKNHKLDDDGTPTDLCIECEVVDFQTGRSPSFEFDPEAKA